MADFPNKIYLSANSISEIKQAVAETYAQYLMLKNLEVDSSGSSSRLPPPYARFYCYLKIYFIGTIQNTDKTYRAEKSFRLINDNPRTITLERLKQLANKVWSEFNNFTFTTGHDTYCYNDPEIGFNRVWGGFHTLADAQALFGKLLDVIGQSPEWEKMSKSTVPIPGDRFSPLPDKVTQAGVLIRPDQERPIALMKFDKCTIRFPHLKSEANLVTRYGGIINSLDFLDPYKD